MKPAVVAVIEALQALEAHERYLGAFIFGSVARGDDTDRSDVDAQVIVRGDDACGSINHPVIAGRKLDLSFISLTQFERQTAHQIAEAERVPFIAESLIVFDKTGDLARIKANAQQHAPPLFNPERAQWFQFLIHHANNKVERHIDDDPLAALFVMHASLYDVLDIHYQIAARWRMSDKRMLNDLRTWDAPLARLVEQFVGTGDPSVKYGLWSRIVDYVVAPLGGRLPISENNCACVACRADLALLTGVG